MAECIVCFEGPAPCATCGCVNIHLHTECLQKMVEATKKTHCTVCLQPYTNVKVHEVITYYWHPNWRHVTVVLLLTIAVIIITVQMLVVSNHTRDGRIGSALLGTVGLLTSCYVVAYSRHMTRRDVRCCVARALIKSVVVTDPT